MAFADSRQRQETESMGLSQEEGSAGRGIAKEPTRAFGGLQSQNDKVRGFRGFKTTDHFHVKTFARS